MVESETRRFIKDVSLGLMSIDGLLLTISVGIEYIASAKPYVVTVLFSSVCLLLSAILAAADLLFLTEVVLQDQGSPTSAGRHSIGELRLLLAAGLILFMLGVVMLEASLVFGAGFRLIPFTIL